MPRTRPHTQIADPVSVPVALLLPPPAPKSRRPSLADEPVDQAGLSAHATCLLIATYTRHGDLVIDLDNNPAVPSATTWLSRRPTGTDTDSDRSVGARPFTGGAGSRGRHARLILAKLPRPDANTLDLADLTGWMGRRRAELAPGGCLITVVSAAGPDGAFHDHATPVITAARAAGLIYHQHFPLLHGRLPENEADPASDAAVAVQTGGLVGGRHARVHSDAFAFTTSAGGTDA